ncbi:hypothetical protein EG68_04554 [Paragonimus skrjabini miyazakii]|uniref:Transmembrane protein n=1 Tax=Paragonimus skrjabini miyazakii TaxID=59628 RepID=A0A8S9YS18_9TREM|nr:hypothetical protein EG68_04554 [Paragonimus skrjabini miyazakii]
MTKNLTKQSNYSCGVRRPRECPSIQSVLNDLSDSVSTTVEPAKKHRFAQLKKSPFLILLLSCGTCLAFATIQLTLVAKLIQAGELSVLLPHHIVLALMLYTLSLQVLYVYLYPTIEMGFRNILMATSAVMLYLMGIFTLIMNIRELNRTDNVTSDQSIIEAKWIFDASHETRASRTRVLLALAVLNIFAMLVPTQNLLVLRSVFEPVETTLSYSKEADTTESDDDEDSTPSATTAT